MANSNSSTDDRRQSRAKSAQPISSARPAPWSPLFLSVASIVFTLGASSLWAAIVAAINGRRLGRGKKTWLAVVLGVVALGGSYLSYYDLDQAPWWAPAYARLWMGWKNDLLSMPSWWIGPGLELGACALICLCEFWPQRRLYREWRSQHPRQPNGMGAPLIVGMGCVLLSTVIAATGQERTRVALAEAEYQRGLELIAQGSASESIEAFSRTIAVAPDNVDAYVQRGRLYSRFGRVKKALADFQLAAELRPGDADLPVDCARLDVILGDYKAAIAHCDRAIKLDSRAVTARFIRAVAQFELGHFVDSLKDVDAALAAAPEKAPDRPLMLAYRGKLHLKVDQPAAAVEDFTEALKLQPENYIYSFDRGLANLQQRKLEDALKDFEEAIRLRPESLDYYLARANVLISMNRPREAVDDCDHVLEKLKGALPKTTPETAAEMAGVFSLRARCRVAMDDLDAASADAAQSIQLDPTWADGYFARGLVATARKDFAAANLDFDRAIGHASKESRVYARALYRRGQNRIALGDEAAGKNDCDEALSLDAEADKLNLPSAHATPHETSPQPSAEAAPAEP